MLIKLDFQGVLIEERLGLLAETNISFTQKGGDLEIQEGHLSGGEAILLSWVQSPTRPLDLAMLDRTTGAKSLVVHHKFWEGRHAGRW